MIIGFFFRMLLKAGLSQGRADKAAPWVAGLVGIALLGAFLATSLHFYVRGKIKDNENAAVAKVAPAHAKAAGERAADTIEQAEQERKAYGAIHTSGPDTAPAPAAVAHNCQRLRRAGIAESSLPAACRSGSGNGAQAGPRP